MPHDRPLTNISTGGVLMEYLSMRTDYSQYAAECACGLRIVLTCIENLRQQMELSSDRTLISVVTSRLKSPDSAFEKCERKYGETSMKRVRQLHDVAGVRIITYFEDDIYVVREALMHEPAFSIVEESDYVASPKDNGYRSLHLIVNVNIYFQGRARIVPVEIQIRDKAMDLWASLEHIIKYKQSDVRAEVEQQFRRIAENLQKFDKDVMAVRDEALEK